MFLEVNQGPESGAYGSLRLKALLSVPREAPNLWVHPQAALA